MPALAQVPSPELNFDVLPAELRTFRSVVREFAQEVLLPRAQELDQAPADELDWDLVRQGQAGTEIYLILDGIFVVEVDGEEIAEIGPGAVVGERSSLRNGTRTATLWARTQARVAAVPPDALDPEALSSLDATHRREE